MESGGKTSEVSWSNQWDYGSDSKPTKHRSNMEVGKKKAIQVADKTKELTVVGYKKAKEGAISGIHWVKDKYNSRKKNH